jgi:fumarate reductase (CoM/CoB) subunit A
MKNMEMKSAVTDVLIIGSGAAGLRAAIEARKEKVQVSLVSKTTMAWGSCTVYAGAGFTAAIGDFSTQNHFKETLDSGKNLNEKELVEIMVNESPQRLPELREFGVDLISRPRGYHCEGRTPVWGLEITKPLTKTAQGLGVKLYERVMIIDFIITDNSVVGALGFDIMNGDFLSFKTKSIVLASGGAGALYQNNDNPERITGDGYAMAYRSGALLQDMEFVQFYPLGLAAPDLPTMILPPSLADFGHFLNANNEDILTKYNITEKPLAQRSRDSLSRALYLEINKGFKSKNPVFLDLRDIDDEMEKEILARGDAFGSMRDILIHKLKRKQTPLQISPLCHHFMGGLKINGNCETNVRGLYAAGEVTGGIHGANRLGGNALSDTIVFGARAGYEAASYAKSIKDHFNLEGVEERKKEIQNYFMSKLSGKIACKNVRNDMKEIMWKKVGIVRTKEDLEFALEELQKINEENLPQLQVSKNRDFLEALEIMNGLIVGELIARAALLRTESRGAHYRSDYPEQNNQNWLKHIIIKKNENEKTPYPLLSYEDIN